jgi:hypothetical protein
MIKGSLPYYRQSRDFFEKFSWGMMDGEAISSLLTTRPSGGRLMGAKEKIKNELAKEPKTFWYNPE